MATIYERLIKAGAPEITEPHFYRISEQYGNGTGKPTGALIVELRKRDTYRGSTLLASEVVQPYGASDVVEETVTAMRDLVDKHLLKAAINELLGEHGPNAS